MSELILNPIIPYIGPISGGRFTSKKFVRLLATVPSNAYGFDINLQCGPNTFPHDDIALQISVRLLNRYIGLNYMHNGIWRKETRFTNIFIEANQKFEIIILCEYNRYKIIFNNEQYCIFPQRIHCEKVTHLDIDGDVSIIQIFYNSICGDLISDTSAGTPSSSTINQFNTHSDKPPSYESAVNGRDDVESQTVQEAQVAIVQFQGDTTSSRKINLTNRWKDIGIGLLVFMGIMFSFALFTGLRYRKWH